MKYARRCGVIQYTSITQNIRGFSLTTVHFIGEGKESRYARRIERFYNALAKAAQDYATVCGKEDPHSRYNCHIHATTEEDHILVTVTLSRKRPGMVSCCKVIRYRWRRGFLESVQVE